MSLGHDGGSGTRQLIALPEPALSGVVRYDTLVCRLLLQAILEELRVFALCLELHFFLGVHL